MSTGDNLPRTDALVVTARKSVSALVLRGVNDIEATERLDHAQERIKELEAAIRERDRRILNLKCVEAIAQQLACVLSLEEMLTKICSLIQTSLQISHVSVLLCEGTNLVLRAHTGLPRSADAPSDYPAHGEPWANILETKGVVIGTVNTVPTSANLFSASVPLVAFGGSVGVMSLYSNKLEDLEFFGRDEGGAQDLESIADICATAISNARYVTGLKQLLDEK
jgi:hypothetical protein